MFCSVHTVLAFKGVCASHGIHPLVLTIVVLL